MGLRSLAKLILPSPIVTLFRARNAPWRGNYSTWADAWKECSGYDQENILERVDHSMEQVVRGLYPYERDSVLFDHIEYSWPLLSGLLWSAGIHGQLNLIDFGGSLGSTYQQNRKFLSSVPHEWHIVEQPAFVSLGRAKYQTNQLRFYGSIEECLQSRKVNTLLISSTLQYLPDPVGFLRQTLTNQFPVVILDRLSIVPGLDGLRLTKQSVSDKIYSASYPCWFFSEDIILDEFKKDYELVERFEAHPLNECFIDGRTHAVDYGYIFRRRNS